jgi:ubiquinone/menaquinone biosynthesis C-methylase UbiE
MAHVFSHEHSGKLEDPWRYEILPPAVVLKHLGLSAGMALVDVGAGTGFFTRPAATIVGDRGSVVATDISGEMLAILRKNGVPSNVSLLETDPSSIPLPDETADFVLAAFVVHEAPDVPLFVNELMRLLKSSGTLAIIEWKKQVEEHGPPRDERLDMADLGKHLVGMNIVDQGELNASHYFVRIGKPQN